MTMVTAKLEGFEKLEQLLTELGAELGSKESNKILRPMVEKALEPIVKAIKSVAPVDTGELRFQVKATTKKASERDRKRKYIDPRTFFLGNVTVGAKYYDKKGNFRPVAIAQEYGYLARGPYKSVPRRQRKKFSELQRIEYGGTKVAPRPFINPGFNASKFIAYEILEKEIAAYVAQKRVR